jgi:phosphopantetheinyl transferase
LSGWSGFLPLPFPAKIELVSLENPADWALDFEMFEQHLGAGDIAYFDRTIKPLGGFRQRDWLVGRIAARRAVSTWLTEADDRSGYDPEIGYDAVGRPILLHDMAEPIFLSVSHKDGIGAAAAADRPVGIDLERLTAVRDPELLVQTAFSPEEEQLLSEAGWAQSEHIAIAWSAKEAAAKSLGRKLLGEEASFAITDVDLERTTIRLAHEQGWVDAFYALDGDFVCVVATTV